MVHPVLVSPNDSTANTVTRIADTLVGATVVVAPRARWVARIAVIPVYVGWRIVRRPPFVPERLTPAAIVERWEQVGRLHREGATDRLLDASVETLDAMVPLVSGIVVDRLDVPDLAGRALSPAAIDALVAALATPALDAVFAHVDPVALVEERIDPVVLEKLVALLVPTVAEAALAQLDLTAIVREHVELVTIANEVVDQLDLVAITNGVVERIDLAAITNDVIDEIDLPGIIRESTSGVATDVVHGTRASAASADEAIARFFGRRRGES